MLAKELNKGDIIEFNGNLYRVDCVLVNRYGEPSDNEIRAVQIEQKEDGTRKDIRTIWYFYITDKCKLIEKNTNINIAEEYKKKLKKIKSRRITNSYVVMKDRLEPGEL